MTQSKKRQKQKMQRGTFIVIDGGEGTGTTTITAYLAEQLGDRCIRTREPGGSPYAEKIRALVLSPEAKECDAETLFLLFWAARRDHMQKTIIPALEAGKIVLSDRFDSSTWAYQIWGQQNTQLKQLFTIMRRECLGTNAPHHYIVLDIDPEIGVDRAKSRGGDLNHFDLAHMDFHRRVRAGFLDFFKRALVRGTIIDASKSLDVVKEESLATVLTLAQSGFR